MIESQFSARVIQAHDLDDALARLKSDPIDLVLVNRKLDRDYSDGLDVIKGILADGGTKDIPVMMVTNYQEHHELAMAAGAVQGFGKLQLRTEETRELLANYLS